MTRRNARIRSTGRKHALREFARHTDLLQFFRLWAGASPELAGLAFMCDDIVETNRPVRELSPTDAAPNAESRAQHSESAGRRLFDLPSAEVHIVRLPLVPTRPLARESKARARRLGWFVAKVAASFGRVASGG